MKAEKPVHYEQHPVTAERKAEIIAAGYRIIDIAYAPEGWKPELKKEEKKAKKSSEVVE